MSRILASIAAMFIGCGLVVSTASADDWLPHPQGAQWQYNWTDSVYNPKGIVENVVVQGQDATGYTLAWADQNEKPPTARTGLNCPQGSNLGNVDLGTVTFQDTNLGLTNTNWNSCPPPFYAPVLCPTTSCANSLWSAFYNVIWGDRVPLLSEPLLRGTSWTATGGASNDVSSTSQYLGMHLVKVPAFPNGVMAAEVRTDIAQAGALGDPYGSGVRWTWWVRGVGPVRVLFDHEGSSNAAVTTVSLLATNLTPAAVAPDENYFPLTKGLTNTYRWTNAKHLPQPEIERTTIDAVANRSARISVKSVSGPLRTAGQYGFTSRLDGVTNIWGADSAATLVKFPQLGRNRHFFTPLDLMTFGFSSILPAYPQIGASWQGGSARDKQVFGVGGSTTIVGVRSVHVPAGTFRALEVRSVLRQPGSSFGSGVRTEWFAPGRGLVQLMFRHRDGSTSLVQLLRG